MVWIVIFKRRDNSTDGLLNLRPFLFIGVIIPRIFVVIPVLGWNNEIAPDSVAFVDRGCIRGERYLLLSFAALYPICQAFDSIVKELVGVGDAIFID
jgi:hypothetical protein